MLLSLYISLSESGQMLIVFATLRFSRIMISSALCVGCPWKLFKVGLPDLLNDCSTLQCPFIFTTIFSLLESTSQLVSKSDCQAAIAVYHQKTLSYQFVPTLCHPSVFGVGFIQGSSGLGSA